MGRLGRVITRSPKETMTFGALFGASIPITSVICLFGEMGSGKTMFAKGLVEKLTKIPRNKVVSPTFVYLNIYGHVYHFDLYRLPSETDFIKAGFSEYLETEGICCCIEWSEKIASIIPKDAFKLTFTHLTETSREIIISKN